jgi:hypothetical protein
MRLPESQALPAKPSFLCSPASEDEPLAKTLQRPAVAAETFAGKPLPAAFNLWR